MRSKIGKPYYKEVNSNICGLKYYHMTHKTTKNTGGSVLTIFGRSDFLGIFLKEMDFKRIDFRLIGFYHKCKLIKTFKINCNEPDSSHFTLEVHTFCINHGFKQTSFSIFHSNA